MRAGTGDIASELMRRNDSFTDAHFEQISGYARAKFGLHLGPQKRSLVVSRLSKRLRALELETFDDYIRFVSTLEGHDERDHLLSALTTNVTHFFREAHHFDRLQTEVLPPLLHRAQQGHRVRLWSAGCSSGQEAYCMAMLILELCPDAATLDVRILGSDVDIPILKRASAGVFQNEELDGLSQTRRDQFFRPVDGGLCAAPHLRNLLTFGVINLVAEWPVTNCFDVIFCRNVAIYFDADTQIAMWTSFADAMVPGGWLMIGHSERVTGPASRVLRGSGMTTYRKVGREQHDAEAPNVGSHA